MEKYVVNPVVVRMQESAKGSIYQSIVAMGFRARQINDDFKAELGRRMEGVAVNTNDENEGGNDDQIKISREFDKYPKPTFLAMKEISDGKLTFEMPEDDSAVEFE
ncbi:MAG: DNA-directed RNA polymerase subunit omega [Chloroflexota bacterium]